MPKDATFAGGNLAYTGNVVTQVNSSGLVGVFGSSDYLRSSSKLRVDDVLVSSGHAAIVTTELNAASSGAAVAVPGDVVELARAVIAGRYGSDDARRAALGDKYDAIQAEVNRLLAGGANAAGTSTGVARLIAGRHKVVASSLNVRSAPNLNASVVAAYGYGEYINSVAAGTVQANGYIWAHYVAYSDATKYVAVGTMDGSEKYLAKA